MATGRTGSANKPENEGGWATLIDLVRRFTAEGVGLRVALWQVVKAARLDAAQAQELYQFVAAADAGLEPVDGDQDLPNEVIEDVGDATAEDVGVDGPPDDFEVSEEEAEEIPDLESLRGTVRVADHDEARRAARAVIAADARRRAPEDRLLSPEEEVGLCLLFRAERSPSESLPSGYAAGLSRDSEAHRSFSAMVLHNQRLVHKILQNLGYRETASAYADLAQHGMAGLIRAVEKFNVSLGCKFSTYATWWIRQSVSRAVVNEGSFIRIPVHMWERLDKVRRMEREFLNRGEKPNVDDLALACKISPQRVVECLRLARRTVVSFELPVGEGSTLGDLVVDEARPVPGPESVLRSSFDREEIFQIFMACGFSGRIIEILLLRYGFVDGERWTLDEIGRRFGVTRERIRQIEKKSIKDMRSHVGLDPDGPAEGRRHAKAEGARPNIQKNTGKVDLRKASDMPVDVASGDSEFGRWLAEQMRDNRVDRDELARRLGVTRAVVSAWLDNRSVPRPDLLVEVKALFPVGRQDRATQAVWYHRPGHEDGGREFGNAAAFAFDPDVEVLARETCQNSLDERLSDTGRPVQVRYTLHELTGQHLQQFLDAAHWDELLPHYEAVADQDQKVGRVVAAGLRDMRERQRLVLLRVDDYNAAGLTGDDYADGRFSAVVRRQLDSRKESGPTAGGSYGLGKATVWGTSRLGLVLINSTLSEPHEGRTRNRVVGRLDLPWRQVGDEALAGPAWFGHPDPESPRGEITRSWWAEDDELERFHLARDTDEPGTSFLIVGAYDMASFDERTSDEAGDEDEGASVLAMRDRLLKALGRNFWAAMAGGGGQAPLLQASVRVLRDGVEIMPAEEVDPETEQPSRTRAVRAFLNGTTVERRTHADDVAMATIPMNVPLEGGGAGGEPHDAVLLVTRADDGDDRHKRLVAMRGNRMVVRDRHVPALPGNVRPFQAVLLLGLAAGPGARGAVAAERFLRASEPPEHNKWRQTEELAARYSYSAHRRIATLIRDANAVVKDLVTVPMAERPAGGERLKKAMAKPTRPAARSRSRRGAPTAPALDTVEAKPIDSGAWEVYGEIRPGSVPEAVFAVPTARFAVRSGSAPLVSWESVEAIEGCVWSEEDGLLTFVPGARRATFRAVTDPGTHPVRASRSGLVVELRTGEKEQH
ncbi:sigma-70 family RNA polymerase sigma factor [Streptomyces sp. BH097]|uniref:sigma-70 family RNA polymerase sigma factor n=1 Tax=unclassified Streptomyces TaxID=2593676 RepID=UPI003BB78E93